MAADIYTKPFTNEDRWQNACRLINIIETKDIEAHIQSSLDSARVENALDAKSPNLEEPAATGEREAACPAGRDVTHSNDEMHVPENEMAAQMPSPTGDIPPYVHRYPNN